MNIDYRQGRISAFREAVQLLQMVHTHDEIAKNQIKILSTYLRQQALLEDGFIEDALDAMEKEMEEEMEEKEEL